jgi:hypothetical protein
VTVSALAAPHYHFVNWSGDTNGATITGTNITVTMAGPKSVAASFAIDRHTLSIGSDWGTPVPAVGTYTNDHGTTLTNQVNLYDTRGTTQYVCTGWAMTGNEPAAGSTTNFAMTLTNNAELIWLWETNYWLATETNGPGTVSVGSGWQGLGSNVTVSALAAPHYHFVNWSGDTNGATITGTNITVTMAGPKSITASFAIDRHTLSVGSDWGTPVPAVGTYTNDYGTTLTNQVNLYDTRGTTQYVCTGWAGTGSAPTEGVGTNTGPFTLVSDTVVIWQWTTQYLFAVSAEGGGTVSGSDSGWYALGGSVTVTAVPATGWRFAGWAGDVLPEATNANPLQLAMDQSRSITARFELLTQRLEVVSAHGPTVPAPGVYEYGYGTVVSNEAAEIEAAGTTQYVCRGWTLTGNEPAAGSTTNFAMTLTNNAALIWLWETNYWLATETNGPGTVSVGSGWQGLGSNVTVSAVAAPHYHFVNWSGDTNGATITGTNITVTMNQARRICADFVPNLAVLGTPEWWLAQYGLTNFNADATRDVDHDGMFTWQEYIAGCDPTNPASVFQFTTTEKSSGQGMVLRWPSISNRFYNLWRATNFIAGTNTFAILPDAINMPATPTMNSYTDEVQGVGPYFYRIDVHE